ncbi:MAG: hypothetical protein GWN58_33025 [Anaerolineae bacterium]|nr:hypothetical protein [Thermoplasmata archaeon]NIV34099.1 hypothetical protein [Anaerolineae bacterium]NIY05950.1 hypothetical protein [Thermoplasmata archaeon]
MGLWARFKKWLARRRLHDEAEVARQDLYQLAHDYETFPKLVPLKKGGWALTAPRYRPVIATTPAEAIRKFRQRNPRKRQP